MKTIIARMVEEIFLESQRVTMFLCAAGVLLATVVNSFGAPTITKQPTSQSISLGAGATFQVAATTTNPPLVYQWRFGGANVPSATTLRLTLMNVQLRDAGDYDVLVTDSSGSTTSQVAHLDVDPAFTKITSGPVVNYAGSWGACAWGDYDNDGFVDLFITSSANPTAQKNTLFHNNRDGTFTRVTTGAIVTEARDWRGCAWADYDNDGHLDLFVTSVDGTGFPDQNFLYRNNGSATFTKMTAIILGNKVAGGYAEGCVFGDYDNDGFLDVFVARYGTDWLLHNNGDGTFARITNNVGITPDNQDSYTAVWGDYDNDGWPDLFVVVKNDFQTNQNNFLYQNNKDGTFKKIVTGSIVTDNEHSLHCAWADYDNDGNLDLFVVNGFLSATNSLYHNNGDGTFTKNTNLELGSIVGDPEYFPSCSWGDYDNDGFVDLFVTTLNNEANFLYQNNGDGTFTRVLSGSLVNDRGVGNRVCAWADYDNDGFLDLIVTRGAHDVSTNLLYRNSGNTNGWIKIKLVGTLSNRSAIGAKVRLKATIGGQTFWQLREINSGNGFTAGPLEAHFGLGDATNLMRCESSGRQESCKP